MNKPLASACKKLCFLFLILWLVKIPAGAETVDLPALKLKFTLPSGYELRQQGAEGWQWTASGEEVFSRSIFLDAVPLRGMADGVGAEALFESDLRGQEKLYTTYRTKIRGTAGAYITTPKDAAGNRVRRMLVIWTSDYMYRFTFMGEEKDDEAIAGLIRKLLPSIRVGK